MWHPKLSKQQCCLCKGLYHRNQWGTVSSQSPQLQMPSRRFPPRKSEWTDPTKGLKMLFLNDVALLAACLCPYPRSLFHGWASSGMAKLQCTTTCVWVKGKMIGAEQAVCSSCLLYANWNWTKTVMSWDKKRNHGLNVTFSDFFTFAP